jgi:hypothetical protein
LNQSVGDCLPRIPYPFARSSFGIKKSVFPFTLSSEYIYLSECNPDFRTPSSFLSAIPIIAKEKGIGFQSIFCCPHYLSMDSCLQNAFEGDSPLIYQRQNNTENGWFSEILRSK